MNLSATRLLTATCILLAGVALSGCGVLSADGDDGNGRRVAAAFYPLEFVAERVAGGHFEVTNLTRPGMEPHDLELTPRETADVARAGLVVFEDGFQPAVDAAVEQNAAGAVIDATEVLDLRPFADHSEEGHADEDGEDGHGHGHDDGDGDLDPHFWQDPLLMADLGDVVAEKLAELDADHAADYRANASALRADLEALDREYTDGLASCARDLVVVNHDAFGYLARYGLHLEPIAGLAPDAEPTPADLARLHDLIRSEGITTVFSETLVSKQTSETVARDLGIATGVLDPIEGLTDETADEDYLSLMRTNLAALQEANGC